MPNPWSVSFCNKKQSWANFWKVLHISWPQCPARDIGATTVRLSAWNFHVENCPRYTVRSWQTNQLAVFFKNKPRIFAQKTCRQSTTKSQYTIWFLRFSLVLIRYEHSQHLNALQNTLYSTWCNLICVHVYLSTHLVKIHITWCNLICVHVYFSTHLVKIHITWCNLICVHVYFSTHLVKIHITCSA